MEWEDYEMKFIPADKGHTWVVGYAIEKDELFVYRVDEDGIMWALHRRGMDVGALEFLMPSKMIAMGYL